MARYEFGFIGTGNMGGALARCAAKEIAPQRIILTNRTPEKARALAGTLSCAVGTLRDVVRDSRFLILGVKPQQMEELLLALRQELSQRKDEWVLVTMAAGLTAEKIAAFAGMECPVIRIMPNTPCAIGEGTVLYTAPAPVTQQQKEDFLRGFAGAGVLVELEESLMDAGSAVSGCGPAFVCQFIEALADGGVHCGLPRDKALALAAQTVAGTGRLVLESGRSPAVLKDQVCSPGGSTIAGVRVLEEGAFRGAVMDGVIASYRRTRELG